MAHDHGMGTWRDLLILSADRHPNHVTTAIQTKATSKPLSPHLPLGSQANTKAKYEHVSKTG